MSYQLVHSENNAENNCSFSLYNFEEDFILSHFPNEIRSKLYDEEGTEQLVNEFTDVSSTEFEVEDLRKVYSLEFETIDRARIYPK